MRNSLHHKELAIFSKVSLRDTLFLLLILCAGFAPAQEIPVELMLRAFNHCYPEKTGAVIFQGGDWTIKAGKETYYWAGGRLLPASLRNRAASFSPFPLEIYPDTVISPDAYSAQYIEALRLIGREEVRNTEDQHRGFQGALFGGLNRREIESHLQSVDFLGKTISVHRDIAAALKRVDAAVRNAAGDSEEGRIVAGFISSIGQIGGYNWREIRGSGRMSYHSWGLAVDIQPEKPDGRAVYWMWECAYNDNWMLIPLRDRWKPPDAVIEAFEKEGFVWGGKWALYDNMHFEYRPELHELNRILASQKENHSVSGSSRQPNRDLHHIYPDELVVGK